MSRAARRRDHGTVLVYGTAFVLVLVGAGFLFAGIWSGTARPVIVSIVASSGALVLVWAGAARGSRPAQGDRHG